jgi:hypothetical protein
MYLPAATVDALAAEIGSQSGVAHWISDINTTAFSKALGGGDAMQFLRHVQAPDALKGEEIFDVLNKHGWTTASWRSYITDVGFAKERILRMTGGTPRPAPPIPPNDPTGVHRFGRR